MAKTNAIYVCPKCDEILPKKVDQCPYCKYDIEKPKNELFEYINFFNLQLKEHMLKTSKKTEKEKENNLKIINEEWQKFLINLPIEERELCLMDSISVIQYALLGSHDEADIAMLSRYCKRIGQIGESLEQYIKAGGKLNGKTRSISTESGDDTSDKETDN